MKILDEREIDTNEAKKIMEEKKKSRELTYEQNTCFEYLEKIPVVKDEKIDKMREELSSIQILKPRYVKIICNMLPETEEDVLSLFMKERTNLTKEEMAQIAEIVKKYK